VSHDPGGSAPESSRPQPSAEVDHVYRGYRTPTAPIGEECTVTVDGEPLERRYDLLSASPTGFEWGYGGSGPAQLAVALLAHAYDDEFACEHYQRFKRDTIADLPRLGWMLTERDLDDWRESLE
jgi:uncharacterized protein (DUF2249 family)